MPFDTDTLVLAGLVVVLVLVLEMPLIRYVSLGWKAKQNDIMGGQNPQARLQYFKMFVRDWVFDDVEEEPEETDEAKAAREEAAADKEFEALYSKWYGRRLYLGPGLLLLLIGTIDTTLVIGSVIRSPVLSCLTPSWEPLDLVGISAITGAYMWVVNDYIARARRLDFSPSDVHWGVLRLTIALPLGYAFASLVQTESLKAFIAFALGAFPLTSIMTMLTRVANKWLGFAETKEEANDGIVKLQGINRDILERLSNEDITTITQFAYCDPVRLTMRSNLSFNFITDCMNQALAWVYLEDKLLGIRCCGLKGAVEIKHLVDDMNGLNDATPDDIARAKATFNVVALLLEQEPNTLRTAFDQIVDDPFTRYLYAVWD